MQKIFEPNKLPVSEKVECLKTSFVFSPLLGAKKNEIVLQRFL